ncbi:hypothetical protein EVG20_g2563 [Dentipellis fragilis]|uniref:Uncharacterized protein n=1 Tax=Dentipellis fragilis TaxID=205917 RepID=A0A4Y9Z6E7_9AGAM|nr:hypothetical protein EVG20_g2563 [Dentipellis fragilis]
MGADADARSEIASDRDVQSTNASAQRRGWGYALLPVSKCGLPRVSAAPRRLNSRGPRAHNVDRETWIADCGSRLEHVSGLARAHAYRARG